MENAKKERLQKKGWKVGSADDFLDLAQGAGKGQARARVEQHRLVPLLQQVDVALERVVRQDLADPPDARGA